MWPILNERLGTKVMASDCGSSKNSYIVTLRLTLHTTLMFVYQLDCHLSTVIKHIVTLSSFLFIVVRFYFQLSTWCGWNWWLQIVAGTCLITCIDGSVVSDGACGSVLEWHRAYRKVIYGAFIYTQTYTEETAVNIVWYMLLYVQHCSVELTGW